MTTTNDTTRDERAQRRAASVERAAAEAAEAAKRQKTAAVTLETDDGATVTLSTEDIRPASGDTPTTTTGGTTGGLSGGQRVGMGKNRGTGSDHRVGSGHHDPSRGNTGTRADTTNAIIHENTSGNTGARVNVSTPLTGSHAYMAGTGNDAGSTGPERAAATLIPTTSSGMDWTTGRPIIVREKAKSLKLTKFKGLDDVMPVTLWLKTVKAEVRRQAVTLGIEWREKPLYHEVVAHLEGEAQRWFATVMESVPESDENINTLADMLRAKYMTQRTGRMPLTSSTRDARCVRSGWLSMSSGEGATHVCGHRPRTLDEAMTLAVPHVGEYGEGYGVGLDTAMGR
ncbi:hypothetical protein PR002_g4295 [Phytophthora rubi]|uniref:Retrotransposon gag domain-containing protein n=1 Tax=Phytophthora rubi TaxID=129364 RepID=A0A6A3NJG8_9STRA|nr:hypothetical protein PR002_g4295 [Phytophthora rubi]